MLTNFKKTVGNKKAIVTIGIVSILLLGLLLFATSTIAVKAVNPVPPVGPWSGLGTASTFAVFATSTITNTGPTTITGDLGLTPGSSVTGFPPGTIIGTQHVDDSEATSAFTVLTNAYNNAAGQAVTMDLSGTDLGTLAPLVPGVYHFSSSAQLTGTLTLNGSPNDVWIFQIGSTLTTASDSHVVIGNAQPCNVIWQVGSSATLGTNTDFNGTILAKESITANTGATVDGRLLALNGAVTLDTNTINNQKGQLPLNVVPEYTLGALAALGASFAALLVYKRKSLPNLHLNTHI